MSTTEGEAVTLLGLIDDYAARGDTRRFPEWCRASGLDYGRRNGLHLARDASGRVVAAAAVDPADSEAARYWKWKHGRHPDSAPGPNRGKPCVGCGAAPVGTYHDGSPRYRCGPHPVTYAEKETS